MNTTTRKRPSRAARTFGYTVAAVVNTVLLYLINVRPGWDAVPFLTADTRRVLPLVNLSLVVGILTNLVYAGHDGPWTRDAGELVANAVALAASARMWAVFPFAFDGPPWPLIAHILLGTATVGAAVAVLARVVSLARRGVRSLLGGPAGSAHPRFP